MKSRKNFQICFYLLLFLIFNSQFLISNPELTNKEFMTEKYKQRITSLIPEPLSLEQNPGSFVLSEQTAISISDQVLELRAKQLLQYLKVTGYDLKVKQSVASNKIELILNSKLSELGTEGYQLISTPEKITIEAANTLGIFYGIQTLRQLLPVQIFGSNLVKNIIWDVPCVKITDKPYFEWRGLLFDSVRHIFSLEVIKRFMNIMAMHKMNKFHWHLTDDVGWRIESEKFPKLNTIGSWRQEETGLYGGYYTKKELKELIKYAEELGITIIPEIEMPAHSRAALAANPKVSCKGEPIKMITIWEPNIETFCAGNDETFDFLESILDEVIEIFPSSYIHIGGDECNKTRWKECPKCQARIKDNNLKDEIELQSYFIKRIEKHLNKRGRDLMGWCEIVEGGLPPNAAVTSWRGQGGGIQAAKLGHKVVMAPVDNYYFNMYQTFPENEPPAFGGFVTLQKVYELNPIPSELNEEQAKNILGVQGCLWSEVIPDEKTLMYQAYPRACALAQVGWAYPLKKEIEKLKKHQEKLEQLDINFRKIK